MRPEIQSSDFVDSMPEIVRQSLMIVGEFLAANKISDLHGGVDVRNGEDSIHYSFIYHRQNDTMDGNTIDEK